MPVLARPATGTRKKQATPQRGPLHVDDPAEPLVGTRTEGGGTGEADEVLGSARIQCSATDPGTAIFVGVARSADAATYLRGVGHHRLHEFGPLYGTARGWVRE